MCVRVYASFERRLAHALPALARAQATLSGASAETQAAADHRHIDNKGVARSLIAKLDAAQAAVDRGQDSVAIRNLEAFVREVDAQADKHIVAEHAAHLRMHAEAVIAALGG